MEYHPSRFGRWILGLVIIVGMLVASGLAPANRTLAYANYCGSPTQLNDCTGQAQWDGNTTGAETRMTVKGISYNSGANILVNALWLTTSDGYWVEAGYYAQYGQRRYYFGDLRPGDGQANFNDLAPVPSGDLGNYLKVAFWENGVDEFTVLLDSKYYFKEVASYPMDTQGYYINIGSELSGSSGAYSPVTNFRFNKWREEDGTWRYQYQNATRYWITSPTITATWALAPVNSTLGGDWKTSCCTN